MNRHSSILESDTKAVRRHFKTTTVNFRELGLKMARGKMALENHQNVFSYSLVYHSQRPDSGY